MQRISYILFIFLLLFSPLAFGTVETWSRTVLETTSAISFLLLGASYILTRTPGLKIPGLTPLFLLLGYMAFQLIPLPIGLVKILSPATFEMYKPILDLAPDTHFIPLTVHRQSTLLMLITFTAYGFFYLLTIFHCRQAKHLKQTVLIVVALGMFIAVEAILQKLTSPEAVYWFRPTPNSSPVGPWVYSNHFAGFMEMLFPLAVALFLYHRPQIKYSTTLKEKFISIMTMPGANRHLLLGTGAMLMAVSILLSVSRGGIMTLGLAFLFFVYFSARTMPDARKRWAMILFIIVILIISWLGWDPIIQKFTRLWGEAGLNTSQRLPVLADTIELFHTYPVFGTGFGTFIHVYPFVRTVPGESIFDHAHNDYIELLANGGLIGFILAGWFLLSVLISAFRKLLVRRDSYAILLTSGALTGILALLFHCLADFQMYNGANGLYLFFLCGLAVSVSHTRLQFRTKHTFLKETNYTTIAYPSTVALLLLGVCIWYNLSAYRAEKTISPFRSVYINNYLPKEKLSQLLESYERSSQLNPLEAKYPSMLGKILTLQDENEKAQHEYLRACLIQPTSGKFVQQLGISLDAESIAKSNELLEKGIQRSPQTVSVYLNYSQWLLTHDQRQESFSVLSRAMERIPWKISNIIDFIHPLRFTENEIQKMLPAIPAAWFEVGRRMEKNSQVIDSIHYYRTAIEIAGKERAKPSYFEGLHRLYKRQKDEKKALETLKMGIRYLPDYAYFRILMGNYYLQKDILYRAKQEYIQALRLDPDNISIQRKLEELNQD